MALIEKITAIADAIRGKTGTEDKLTLEQMADEIDNMSGGSAEYCAMIQGEMESFTFPEEATVLRPYAFYKASKLKHADLRGCSLIGDESFRESGLESVVFDESMSYPSKNLGARVFSGAMLTEVNSDVSMTLTTATPGFFQVCKELKTVYLPKVNINNSIGTFNGCTALEKVVINAAALSNSNFNGCTSLTALVLLNDSVSTLGGINNFTNTPIEAGTGYIYVPRALLSDEDATKDYRRATNWVNFKDQFRAIEDYPEICGGGVGE